MIGTMASRLLVAEAVSRPIPDSLGQRHWGVILSELGHDLRLLELTRGGVKLGSVVDFHAYGDVRREGVVARDPIALAGIAARVRSVLSQPLRWNLLTKNCEHFARFVVWGKPQSLQVNRALAVVGLVALLVLATRCRRR